MIPGDFDIVEEGCEYKVPAFEVVENKGLNHVGFNSIYFVRGSKLADEQVEKKIGTTHESLLELMIHDLKYKNSLVPSRETALAITNLEQALGWMKRRQEVRKKAGTQGTYKT